MRISVLIGRILLTFGVFLALLIYPVIFVSQCQLFYDYHFQNHPSPQIKNNIESASEQSRKITTYLITGRELPVESMSQRAVTHMFDVRAIYLRALSLPVLLIIFPVLGLLVLGQNPRIKRTLATAAICVIGFCLVILIGGSALFREIFLKFHYLFYTNDLWILEENDLLIRLYPEVFFSRLFLVSGTISVTTSAIILLVKNLKKIWKH